MSSKNPLVTTTEKKSKEGINNTKTNLMWRRKPSLIPLQQIKLTQSMKQTNHKRIKLKKINPSAINQIGVYHWIYQGLLKAMKQKTQ